MKVINLKKEKPIKAIQKAVAVLKKSGLVIYPTETCYGLGADATNPKAVKKLLQYKGGRGNKPLSVAVANQAMAEKYVILNSTAKNLYRNFLPGPLTVVSQSRNATDPHLQAAGQTLGIRIPNYLFVLKLIARFGKSITATSANTSGKKQPYSFTDWQRYTSTKKQKMIGLFLDAGPLPERQPSTVVDTILNEPTVLRQGQITLPQIAGQTFISNSEKQTKAIAQKILSHFAPPADGASRDKSHFTLVFAIQGELGSGKTQFVKGLATALGIKTNVPSPTFVLAREYPYRFNGTNGILYHIDTWRMEKGEELLELGLKKMLKPGNVIAIEWLQKVKTILEKLDPKKVKIVWIEIETLSPTKRRIKYRI